MKFKDWAQITNGIDEYEIFSNYSYYPENKSRVLEIFGEDEIDEIFINAYEDGAWVVATIYLK